ncbi:nucleotide disphospho-sugar-binding domain-containing protein [Sphaerisporangium perillae]|uniref:nucleotide disphospho-sugar-binding domain-containing protein n=1 Tax=Sphaerisporangium perillae TaxID=2935860 RepID=UPI00200CCC6A|nr:nucleotide disphospho-sugar-binding domain-containing protein [Sphaerisporangium perillae]
MRLLFTTFAERPHFYPMVPLAWACMAAGHEVRMASTPSLVETITQSGLPAVAVGHDLDLAAMLARGDFAPKRDVKAETPEEQQRAAWSGMLENLANMQFAMCEAMVDDLVAYGRAWRPDVIVHDPVTFAGPVTGQVLGVPTVAHMFGSPGLLRIEMKDLGSEPLPGFLKLFERFGVEPRHHPTAWIDPCPPILRLEEGLAIRPAPASLNRYQERYVPYNGPGASPDWLFEPPGRPRVCVTWGTTQERILGESVTELVRRVVGAVAGFDVEVIFAGSAELRRDLGELPGNVRLVDWVPLHMLLPTCAAIVHQGGAGTTLTSAVCGVPQLGITEVPEPRISIEQLAATGAGHHLFPADATAERVREIVAGLLEDPSYGEAARRVQADIQRQPAPAGLVPVLEKLAGTEAR